MNLYKSNLKYNNKVIKKLFKLYDREYDFNEKVLLLELIASYIGDNASSIFRSSDIEKRVESLAHNKFNDKNIGTLNEEILHVVTEVYSTGGHTRLINNIIRLVTDKKHSLLITNSNAIVPEWLSVSIKESGGTIYQCINNDEKDKIKFIRKTCSKYKYVFLSIHPNDISTNVALLNKTNSTIFFVNHADHRFWVAGEVADYILDLSLEGNAFTKSIRNFSNSGVIGIPLEDNKDKYREKSNNGVTTILSVADSHKFNRYEHYKFDKFIMDLLKKNNNCEFIIVGKKNTLKYRIHNLIRGNKIYALGKISKDELNNVYKKTDIYVDSFPINSYTCLLEAIMYTIPSFALMTPLAKLDFETEFPDFLAKDIDTLIERICLTINCKTSTNVVKIKDYIVHRYSRAEWIDRFNKILNGELETSDKPYKGDINEYNQFIFGTVMNKSINTNMKKVSSLKFENRLLFSKAIGYRSFYYIAKRKIKRIVSF